METVKNLVMRYELVVKCVLSSQLNYDYNNQETRSSGSVMEAC